MRKYCISSWTIYLNSAYPVIKIFYCCHFCFHLRKGSWSIILHISEVSHNRGKKLFVFFPEVKVLALDLILYSSVWVYRVRFKKRWQRRIFTSEWMSVVFSSGTPTDFNMIKNPSNPQLGYLTWIYIYKIPLAGHFYQQKSVLHLHLAQNQARTVFESSMSEIESQKENKRQTESCALYIIICMFVSSNYEGYNCWSIITKP